MAMIAARHQMPAEETDAVADGGDCLRKVRGRAMMRQLYRPCCGAISGLRSQVSSLNLKSQISSLETQGIRLQVSGLRFSDLQICPAKKAMGAPPGGGAPIL